MSASDKARTRRKPVRKIPGDLLRKASPAKAPAKANQPTSRLPRSLAGERDGGEGRCRPFNIASTDNTLNVVNKPSTCSKPLSPAVNGSSAKSRPAITPDVLAQQAPQQQIDQHHAQRIDQNHRNARVSEKHAQPFEGFGIFRRQSGETTQPLNRFGAGRRISGALRQNAQRSQPHRRDAGMSDLRGVGPMALRQRLAEAQRAPHPRRLVGRRRIASTRRCA